MNVMAGMLAASLMLLPQAVGAQDVTACDRNFDGKITVGDALVTLQAAVSSCLTYSVCDADGDSSEDVTDALAILQYAVGLPVVLECSCYAIDQCFDNSDCTVTVGYPPGYFCLPYFCVACDLDTDCGPGFVCNHCQYTCEPEAQ